MWLKVKWKKLKDFYSFGKNGNVKEQNRIILTIEKTFFFLSPPERVPSHGPVLQSVTDSRLLLLAPGSPQPVQKGRAGLRPPL